MPDEQGHENKPLSELVNELAQEAARKYRIETSAAYHFVMDEFESNSALRQTATQYETAQKLKRTRVFKSAANDVKKKIYYQLRSYRSDSQQVERLISELEHIEPDTPVEKRHEIIGSIVAGHASTRERLPSKSEFYRQLFELADPPREIVDIGCGVHPLMFPFDTEWSRQIQHYVAAEKNGRDVECINHLARIECRDCLVGIQWDLADGWSALETQTGCPRYGLALIMKVVPVVCRQQRELLSVLAETPADTWLLTGSRIAMAKRRSIERREKRVLEEFVALAGRTVKHEFVVEEEFAWIVV